MADDFKANARTTGTVSVGGNATGEIETRRDVDWFAVELVAGRTYVIDLEGAPGGGGTLADPMLRGLYDAEGQRIAGTRNNDGGEGADARLTFTATASGTHYIAARSHGDSTGSYTVRVTAFDADATAAGATDLADLAALDRARVHKESVDGGAYGTDYYRFTLSEAQTVKLTLRRQDADADLYLEDADGAVLHASTRNGTRNEGIEATLQAGTYYVRVTAQEAGENAYNLRYRAEDPEAQPEPEPQPDPEPQPEPEEPDPPENTKPLLQRSPPPPVVPTNVSEPEGQDFAADTSTQGRVAVGGSVSGRLALPNGFADTDWFAVTLETGKTYRIELKGASTGDGTLSDPWIRGVYAATGDFVGGDDDNGGVGTNSRAFFTLPSNGWYWASGKGYARLEDGTYYVGVSGFVRASGTYTLSVEEFVHADDYAADTSTTGRLTVGGSVQGNRETSSDVDWFAVELEAGSRYRFDLEGASTGKGTLEDPYLLGIYNANGALISGTKNNDGGSDWNSRVFFTATEDGTYYVSAGASESYYFRRDGTYTLSVEEIVDTM